MQGYQNQSNGPDMDALAVAAVNFHQSQRGKLHTITTFYIYNSYKLHCKQDSKQVKNKSLVEF